MYAIQLIAILFLIWMAGVVVYQYYKKHFEIFELVTWLFFIGILFIIALEPVKISMEIKDLLGLGRGLDALLVLGIGGSYLLLFKLYLEIDRLEREITTLTRKITFKLEEIEEVLEKDRK